MTPDVACTGYPNDGTAPDTTGAYTAESVTLFGRSIELRYNPNTRTAWGRIENGSPGDEVWVNRSSCPDTVIARAYIYSGYTEAYTTQWDDAGFTMRACGRAYNRSTISCTTWF